MKDLEYFKEELSRIIIDIEKEEYKAKRDSERSFSENTLYYFMGCNSALTGVLGPLKKLQLELLTNE